MRLIRLHAEAFGPIREAAIELGPGLNVLYGHNDLGKSYLAEAIRAVLLLPHTSTAHQQFVRWGSDDTPRVTLVLRTGDVYWRVSKAFGKTAGAAATLERSASGDQWAMEAKGRDVDGRLRGILEWGIPEPGGKGKKLPRGGLPRSFLTHVLLAEQDEATSVFEHSLEDDPDESGKQLLGRALQALAQDPLFKSVLEHSQGKVDEAFLPSGNKRRGRRDPFTLAGAAVREALAEHELRKQQREETRQVQQRLQELSHDRLEAEAAVREAERTKTELERSRQAWQRRREADAVLAGGEAEVARVTATESEAGDLAAGLAAAEEKLTAAGREVQTAEQAVEQAKEQLRELASDAGAHRRALEKEQLEKSRLELQTQERDARARLAAAEQARERERLLEKLAEELERGEAAQKQAEAELGELLAQQQAQEKEQRLLRGVGALLAWQRAQAELDEATAARDRAAELRRQAAERRDAARDASRRGDAAELPDAETIRALRALEQELGIARARHAAGLSVRLRLKRALDVEVSADGDSSEPTPCATGEHLFEAERSMWLRLGGLAEIEVLASAPEAREAIETLERRWRKEARPALEAAGVSEIDALEEARQDAETARREAAEHTAEAERSETQAAELDGLARQVAEREQRAKSREVALGDFDRSALEAFAQAGEDADAALETGRLANEQALRRTGAQREEKKSAIDRARSDLDHLRQRLDDERRRHAEQASELTGPWHEVRTEAEAALSRVTTRLAEVAERLGASESEQGGQLAEAEAGVATAEERRVAAREALAEATAARDTAKGALESKRGQLEVLRESAGKIDLEALRARAEAAAADVAALPEATRKVGESTDTAAFDELAEAAERELEARRNALAERSRETDKLHGALEQVGGDVAVEREKAALDALLRAREKERELELDYGAWRLLAETLREAENEESTHLGRALVAPVSRRFAELTGDRYGRLGLGPDLETTGIQAAGEERPVDTLSQGLREQLATLLRVSVAQHLGSMIVLDDHLTHTDPKRLTWFRDVLRQAGEEVQIVVLTCRPLDYLQPGELARDQPLAIASDRLQALDLERIIQRAGS